MAVCDLAQQTAVEHTLLQYLMEGLRTTIAWQQQGDGVARKLSTLRFIGQSFQRHLERLLALEECDGYMDLVLQRSPQLRKTVDALREEHEFLRRSVRRIVLRLEQMSGDPLPFRAVCAKLIVLLDKLDEHDRKETSLIQEAFEREVGGEA